MPFTFVTPSISNTLLKVRWKEQYGSAGFNKKLYGIVPHGIYRGLTLGASGSNNTVTVVPDTTYQDHLAVYETADGYSITLRDDANTTYSLDLSDASLLGQTVVITVFVEYVEGASSSAVFIAYTLTEYNGLSASLKKELLVLGTVVNPGAGNTISSSSITEDRRTFAAFNMPLAAWRPLLGNTGFERSPSTGEIIGTEVEGWSSTGKWEPSSIDVGSGTRCIQYNATATGGSQTESVYQYIGTSVTAGQKILVRLSKKVVGASSAGNGLVKVGYTGSDGGSASEQTSTFVITATDASYSSTDYYFTVPAGAITLKYIGFGISAGNYASTGIKVRVDSVQAYLQPSAVELPVDQVDDRYRALAVAGLTFAEAAETSYGDRGAFMRFSRNVPTSEGKVSIQRRDQNYTGGLLAPALSLDGRVIDVGNRILGSAANRELPRFHSPHDSTSFTLIFESALSGESTGGYTQPVSRKYVGSNGYTFWTLNARWDGGTSLWNKDVTGQEAYLHDGFSYSYVATGTNTWTVWIAAFTSYVGKDFYIPGMLLFETQVALKVPPSMWMESGNLHTKGPLVWILATSTNPVYVPIPVVTGAYSKQDAVVHLQSYRLSIQKNTDSAAEINTYFVEVTNGSEAIIGTQTSNTDNAPGNITIVSAQDMDLLMSPGLQYYLKIEPSASVTPAADRLFGAEIEYTIPRY